MKKILCLITILLVFICTAFASGDFLSYVQKRAEGFKLKQENYYVKSKNQTDAEKEIAFKKLYINYINYYAGIIRYYKKLNNFSIDNEYVKEHKDEYITYGLGFNILEGNWEIEEDYTMLLSTPKIPKVWTEWLNLQQKYIETNRKKCTKSFRRNSCVCEGGTMTISQMEQAIVELGMIEQKSKVIESIKSQDFDFIPYTSRELVETYLMGNDLRPIFDWGKDDSRKLNKKSQKSFEHFIKYHKNSKYWDIVNEYYNKLQQNNFIYSAKINAWLIDELESVK